MIFNKVMSVLLFSVKTVLNRSFLYMSCDCEYKKEIGNLSIFFFILKSRDLLDLLPL